MCGSSEPALEFVSRGHHLAVLRLMRDERTSLYARKALAATLCNLAQCAENAAPLGRAGVVSALVEQQQADARLRRQRVGLSASRLAAALVNSSECVLDELPEAERALVTPRPHPSTSPWPSTRALTSTLALALTLTLHPHPSQVVSLAAAEAAAVAESPLHAVRASLIESGVLLYLHTAAGGAAWGLFESVRSR